MSHGDINLRGINPPLSRFHTQGRFGRLFPGLRPFAPDLPRVREKLQELGNKGGLMDAQDPAPPAVSPTNADNDALSSGFTFLGQFLDHDLTFDPTSSLERQNDPEAIENFRTPALELDNVYGSGPGASPHLYDLRDPAKLLIDEAAPNDVPRNSQNVAIIGDPRNDENLIVNQLHLAMLKFHNALVDHVRARGTTGAQVFEEAQRLTRWHYQWMIIHEFLPRTVGGDVVRDVLNTPPRDRFYQFRNQPFIPVEFAVAAYRFGHSQVRPGYRVNAGFAASIFNSALPLEDPDPNDLRGGKRAARRFVEWQRFFLLGDPALRQLGKKIDTTLSSPLFQLPPGVAANPNSLAQRNLLRGLAFGLPSGQDMARAMRVPVLTPGELDELRPLGVGFERSTPPWYYILREAELRGEGKRLGPLGGRIVAEVFLGVLQGDRHSYLSQNPDWKPELAAANGEFTIGDLLKFAKVA